MARLFPRELNSGTLGPLLLMDDDEQDDDFRVYRSEAHRQLAAVVKAVGIVWPAPAGIVDADRLIAHIEQVAATLIERLELILLAARPVVDEAIARFCVADDEYTPPSAAELLRRQDLEMIKLGVEIDHEIQL